MPIVYIPSSSVTVVVRMVTEEDKVVRWLWWSVSRLTVSCHDQSSTSLSNDTSLHSFRALVEFPVPLVISPTVNVILEVRIIPETDHKCTV